MIGASGIAVERFGDYQLTRYLTAGGMADLYLARGPDGGAELVLKRIQQRYVDHTQVVRLFVDEGRIAKTLDHPNIVRTLDVGQIDGTYFIVMEYIAGHDLIAIARRGMETGRFVPRAIAVALVAQAAAGLAYAHTNRGSDGKPLSIVHCDISPGNIVVSWRGTAKIVDFGIARAAIQLRSEDGVAGKFNYMAPEQIRGEKVDARADLFSLGVILYELTLGKRLFKGKPAQVRHKMLEGSIPRPRDVNPDYPERLERILGRLLARDPEQRYPSAAALRFDLRRYLKEEETGWDKREIARYLRQLFHAPLRSGASDPEFAEQSVDPDMGPAMPSLNDESIEADADDLFDQDTAMLDGFDVDTVVEVRRADERIAEGGEVTPADGIVTPAPATLPDEPIETRVAKPIAATAGSASATPRADEARRQSMSGQIPARAHRLGEDPSASMGKVQVEPAIDLDPTARVSAPSTRRQKSIGAEAATALVRLPERDRRRAAERSQAALEVTYAMRNPPRRRRRRTIDLSTEMVVGGCMVIAALLILILILVSR